MDYLPREIVLDILSRLPVTSLLQFKLVCRAWHNIAQDPLLPGMHLSRTGENDPYLILHCDHPTKNQLYLLELSARNEDNPRVNKILVPTLPEFEVVGSCKGLLCLCNALTKNSLFIYNPFTRDYIGLPHSREFPNQNVVFAFGFHQTGNEYKVLKIVSYRNRCNTPFRLPVARRTEAQVFTLGSPGWRNLGKVAYSLRNRPSPVLVNGRLHWGRHCPYTVLISFDLADEQFRVVPQPTCGGFYKRNITLVDIKGCLSAAVNCNYGQIDIWVMKEYDVKESWVKQYRIGIHVPRGLEQDLPQLSGDSKFYCYSSFVRVLGLLKNGVILLEYKRRALVSYDPRNKTFKDLVYHQMPYFFESNVHEGSLNWIETVNIVA